MSWKKNAISYLIWFLYTIMTGTVLLALATEAGKAAGLEDYTGILIMAASVAVAGVAAFLLHRFAVSRASFAGECISQCWVRCLQWGCWQPGSSSGCRALAAWIVLLLHTMRRQG